MTHTLDTESLAGRVPTAVLVWTGLVGVEALAVGSYFVTTSATVEAVRYLVYPFLWINAGLWAVATTRPAPGSRRHRGLGLSLAGAYFLLVMGLSGSVGGGIAHAPPALRVVWYAPGWGPLVAATSPWLRLYLVPFEVVGYASLSYLVYANALAVARGTLSGVLGLLTCVGCTVPVLAPFVGLLGGPATALTTTAYQWSYDVGTLLYLVTVVFLVASYRRSVSDR